MPKLIGKTIFIVEDDTPFIASIKNYFNENNKVIAATTFTDAKNIIKEINPDIILLDILLPDGSGLDLIPSFNSNIPIIILSDLGTEDNILQGLQSGASDYMVKPYSLKILEQRMILRLQPHDKAYIAINGLVLDTNSRLVSFEGKPLNLTKSEFDILYFLMKNAGTFFTSAELYENIWNMESLNTGTIRYHIHNLREKMRAVDERCEELLITKFGGGYALRRG